MTLKKTLSTASHKLSRRFLAASLIVASAAACGGDTILDPVQTADGTWSGTQNGYSFSLGIVQADTLVGGNAVIASVAGTFAGTFAGSFKYPNLNVTITVVGAAPVTYVGTMSPTQAKISGRLDGAGIDNVEVDIIKK